MILTVASGKGGTGKTTISTNLAAALGEDPGIRRPVRLLDCDVEEPNDHLFVRPRFSRTETVTAHKPVYDEDLCTGCGKCARHCRYNALAVVRDRVMLFPELCHACGVCSFVCPEGALTEAEKQIGVVELDEDREDFAFVHGALEVGETLAPRVVAAVKSHARPNEINIIDAAPGTGCPVAEAVMGVDAVLLVTEPTPFGLNDLKLASALALEQSIPAAVVVNRSDGSDQVIASYAEQAGIPIIGRVPFRREYAETYSRGELLVEHHPEVAGRMVEIYRRMQRVAREAPPEAPAREKLEPQARAIGQPKESGASRASEMTVISGKGGTGKTTVTAALASLLPEDLVLADCDVDAADMHLLLHPQIQEVEDFVGGVAASVDPDRCVACGLCGERCHFGALSPVAGADGRPSRWAVDELACEGCGLCALVCPQEAVRLEEQTTGQSFVSETRFGPMARARLGVGAENSGKLVTHVRRRARELSPGRDRILCDGSPGTSCPVIASLSGVDAALIVTEPSVSGVHDLERVLELTAHFGVPSLICINKCDLNAEQCRHIERMAARANAPIVGRIPFDDQVNQAVRRGRVITECGDGEAAGAVREMADELRRRLTRMRAAS